MQLLLTRINKNKKAHQMLRQPDMQCLKNYISITQKKIYSPSGNFAERAILNL